MKRILAMTLALVMVLGLLGPVSATETEDASRVETLLNSMSLRDKVTQMLMVDFRYWDEDLTDRVCAAVSYNQPFDEDEIAAAEEEE